MRILFLGDVMGRSGRRAVIERVPELRREWALDFVVVNGENATSGRGLSIDHAKALLGAGVDCLTLGDHAFDQRELMSFIGEEPRILRPLNYAKHAPGRGAGVFDAGRGRKILVMQVLGQLFMKRAYADPFSAVEEEFVRHPLRRAVNATLVDIHCEATSEKVGMGHFCSGKASAVVGTHTHVPTADAMILSNRTAFLSDAGMCGDFHSVIGMEIDEPMQRFVSGMSGGRLRPADGEATLCGFFVETDDESGRAVSCAPIRQGGLLPQQGPGG